MNATATIRTCPLPECLTGLQQVQQAVPDAVGQVEAGDDQLEGRMQPVARAFDSRGILT
jgi:hypothetical protein